MTKAEAPTGAVAEISAVVVTWRTGPRLWVCLETLLSDADVAEVILVDNGNPPDVEVALAARAATEPRLHLLTGHGNIGFGRGCNLGARAARSPVLAFVNPDAAAGPGALARLAQAGADLPRPWIVGGRIVGLDGREQRGGRRAELTFASGAVDLLGLERLGLRSMHLERTPLPETPQHVGAISGAFFLMRADDFARLGGFDEGYFAHVEDIDLCRRARAAGGAVVFVPDAVAEHAGATSDASPLRIAQLKASGLLRYYWKFHPTPWGRLITAALAPAIVAGAGLSGLLKTLPRAHRSDRAVATDRRTSEPPSGR